jgi:hypothetical protein
MTPVRGWVVRQPGDRPLLIMSSELRDHRDDVASPIQVVGDTTLFPQEREQGSQKGGVCRMKLHSMENGQAGYPGRGPRLQRKLSREARTVGALRLLRPSIKCLLKPHREQARLTYREHPSLDGSPEWWFTDLLDDTPSRWRPAG